MRFRRRPEPQPQYELGTVNHVLALLMRLQVQNMGDLPIRCIGTDTEDLSALMVRPADPDGPERVVLL